MHISDMLFCMRTTLNLDDELMAAVKRTAANRGTTMTAVVEEALVDAFARVRDSERASFILDFPTVKGTLRPGVDLSDRDLLYEVMDGRL